RVFHIALLALQLAPNTMAIDAANEGDNGLQEQVFKERCFLCHRVETIGSISRNGAPADVNFDSYEAAVQSGARTVIRAAIEKTMPPADFPLPDLTQAQIDALIAWQAAGFPRTATTTVTPPPNQAPTANSGMTQNVNEGTSVSLIGSGSDAEDGANLSFAWTQMSGIGVMLLSANSAQASFTAPDVPAGGTVLTFQLTVTDSGGLTGAQTVTINVADIPIVMQNLPPVANISTAPNPASSGETVILSGVGSIDSEDGAPSTFFWLQTAGTPVSLSSATDSQVSFIAPPAVAGGEFLSFMLTVTDRDGLTGNGQAIISINGSQPNITPSASAGMVQVVNAGDVVTLDGSGSMDAEDGMMLSFAWLQRRGPAVTLSNASAAQPTFMAPAMTNEPLLFELIVTDRAGATAMASTVVHIGARPILPVGIPRLPGVFGLDADGSNITPPASTFDGGVLVAGSTFMDMITPDQPLSIEGNINIAEADRGKMADLIVVVLFQPSQGGGLSALQQDVNGGFSPWDLNPATLQPVTAGLLLDERHRLEIFNGALPADLAGDFQIFLAYRLKESNVLIIGAPIEFTLLNM
ncbi:MAG: hypothetical protein AAF512_13655, partial [Pseudomonadota bacterium]